MGYVDAAFELARAHSSLAGWYLKRAGGQKILEKYDIQARNLEGLARTSYLPASQPGSVPILPKK